MHQLFYSKLAVTNLLKNKIFYFPFVIVSAICSAIYYILVALSSSSAVSLSLKSYQVKEMLGLGSYILIILSILFIIYANSFVIKRRKKEFGLYGILGLEKRHVVKVIGLENAIIYVVSMLIGSVVGLLFGKLGDLLLLRLTDLEEVSRFIFSLEAILKMLMVYGIIFVFLFVENTRAIYFSNSIELLKAKNVGEKEPKANVVIALFSFICLCCGYGLAVSINEPSEALLLFFIAVLFVVVGTYTLFISGSVFILKLCKKHKKFYYRPNNFFSISSLLYRMKQNATGLASICVLSTMVVITILSTMGLYGSIGTMVGENYQFDYQIMMFELEKYQELVESIDRIVVDFGLEMKEVITHEEVTYTFIETKEEQGVFYSDNQDHGLLANIVNTVFISLDDYNQMMNTSIELGEDQVLVYRNRKNNQEVVDLSYFLKDGQEKTFDVVAYLDELPIKNQNYSSSDHHTVYLIVNEIDEIRELFKEEEYLDTYRYYLVFNTTGKHADKIELADSIVEEMQKSIKVESGYSLLNRSFSYVSNLSIFGVMLFLGVFLGIAFLFVTILIIYYKQISEGYDDKERFMIMQKVGMSQSEVKTTIQRQIIIFFFLPLLIAIVHTIFGFKMLQTAFQVLGVYNSEVLVYSGIIVVVVFSIIYYIVYRISAKVYYRLVRY